MLRVKDTSELDELKDKYVNESDFRQKIALKKQIENNTISLVHGNKDRKPINALSEEEKDKIRKLYSKSTVSIRKFCKFYNTRSYSCIYNAIKKDEK